MSSTTIGVIIPSALLMWLDERAKARGVTRSRLVAQMILDESGLDLVLSVQGRSLNTAKKQATREIADATGQVPIGNPNLGW